MRILLKAKVQDSKLRDKAKILPTAKYSIPTFRLFIFPKHGKIQLADILTSNQTITTAPFLDETARSHTTTKVQCMSKAGCLHISTMKMVGWWSWTMWKSWCLHTRRCTGRSRHYRPITLVSRYQYSRSHWPPIPDKQSIIIAATTYHSCFHGRLKSSYG